jgi:general secretion pathway protein E
MPVDALLQAAIADEPDVTALRRCATQSGMRLLRHAAAGKVAAGVTTVEEALALTPDPQL